MGVVIGTSAWAWHATPPLMWGIPIPPAAVSEIARDEPGLAVAMRAAPRGIPTAVHHLSERLLGELKGVPLPVDAVWPDQKTVLEVDG